MPKEILLYGTIYNYTAQDFIDKMEEAKGDAVNVRVNSGGGEVLYGYGMIAKFKEHAKRKTVQVDGDASSMALMFVLYAANTKAINQARFVLHRASYGEWFEKSAYFTQAHKDELLKINKDFEAALRSKIDVPVLERMKNVTMADIFSLDKRIDVNLTAQEAKEIGLIEEIIDLTPDVKADIEAKMLAHAEEVSGLKLAAKAPTPENPVNQNTVMTLEKLKAEHPALYAQIIAEGEKLGIKKEQDRVGAWMAWAEVDPKKVKEGIDKGEEISAKATQEFTVAMLKGDYLKKLSAESAENVSTDAGGAEGADKDKSKNPKTAAEKSLAEFEADLDKGKKKTAAAA